MPIGARVGVWVLDRAGAHRLKHYRGGDDDPIVISHSGGRPCPWARCLAPVSRQRACGWVWAGAHTHSCSCNDDNDIIIIASVVGEGRGPEWGPVGVPG